MKRLSLLLLLLLALLIPSAPAQAVTTGNGALVYSPPAGSSFDPAGTTYAKVIALKNNGSANGTLLVTYDQLVYVNGVQVYPIYRSTDGGTTWSHLSNVVPSQTFSSLTLTSQPFLYELPQQVGALAAGTIILAGMIMPADRSSSRIVLYTSTDRGATWAYHSTVDTGGPAVYDPSPTSTTTTVWEPSLNLDPSGNLVCYYSDERQKSSGILQAVVYRRSTDGGLTWGPVTNVAAVGNSSDRPGMITVTRLPNGKYLAAYEVVNRPSQSLNTAVNYYKISDDGLTWPGGLGTPIRLADGRGMGSSPFVRWVSAGGPNGMVVVSAKWGLDSSGNINGGQDFFVNYNLGQGPWERLPYAVTYDASDTQGGYFSGFAQGFDTSPDGLTLYQATNVENTTTGYNDIRVGTIPLNADHYEAERATRNNTQLVSHADASNGSKVGNINFSDSYVQVDVNVPAAGTYTINVRYANGTGATSGHAVSVNGGSASTLSYPPTVDWGRYRWAQLTRSLNAGANTIRFTYNGTYAELDFIDVYHPGTAVGGEFKLVNRSSGKYLEILSALTTDGAGAGQWGDTDHPAQIWRVTGTGPYTFTNKNSGKLLEIPSASTADGTQAVQWGATGHATQTWQLTPTDTGYYKIPNANSGKLLEIYQNSAADGAIADQWSDTGCGCQQWTLVKEGIQ
ncbi:RICIN domain-containing protein [Nonomuraea turcica]|uniref:RICIN domain-containing protein n=1 Tax=Nonomuraea sp. G32 TaxID=3067274 RepID=UPI00273BC1DC|nr:RICIN domain-containing protein [Nonomuraea sp. G32]MDP4502009.1 RICIN domain-containing protein [Nonomuraea sp. G32]